MQTITPSKFLLMDWDVKWGTYSFGGVDKVIPDMNLILKPKKVGSVGDIEIGHWIIGLSGKITVEAREIDHTHFEQVVPWNQGSTTASIPLFPNDANGATKDLYDYAQALILHPSHLPTNTTSLDLTLAKAVPMTIAKMDADGAAENANKIDFTFYLDRSLLPRKVYGWVGPAV